MPWRSIPHLYLLLGILLHFMMYVCYCNPEFFMPFLFVLECGLWRNRNLSEYCLLRLNVQGVTKGFVSYIGGNIKWQALLILS